MNLRYIIIGDDHVYTLGDDTVHFNDKSFNLNTIITDPQPWNDIFDYSLRHVSFMDPGFYLIQQCNDDVYKNVLTGIEIHDNDFAMLFSYTDMIRKLFTTSL